MSPAAKPIPARLDGLCARPTRSVAEHLETDLDEVAQVMDEAMTSIGDLIEQIQTWTDPDSDRETRTAARQEIETMAGDLATELRDVVARLS